MSSLIETQTKPADVNLTIITIKTATFDFGDVRRSKSAEGDVTCCRQCEKSRRQRTKRPTSCFNDGVQPYLDRSGNSGVVEFENQPDSIVVRFRGGDLYVYTAERVGRHHVEEMKRLAVTGRGLSTYINRHPEVREGYARYDPDIHGDLD